MNLVSRLRRYPETTTGIVRVSDLLLCGLLPLALATPPLVGVSLAYSSCCQASLGLAVAAWLVYLLDMRQDDVEGGGTEDNTPARQFSWQTLTVAASTLLLLPPDKNMGERYILYTVYWAVLSYRPLLHKLLTTFPLSFSYGEAALVCQGTILTVTATLIPHFTDTLYLPHQLASFISHCWEWLGSSLLLVSWWGFLSLGAVAVVAVYNKNNYSVSTATRKIFHLAVILVYIPGLSYDPLLLYTASLGAAGLMLGLECLRWTRVVPLVSDILDIYLSTFTDSKEGGSLILTHLYLLVGVSLPLWVWPHHLTPPAPLPLYAGVLSVGVADAAASLIGSRWGKTYWPQSAKTVEGSVGAVAVTLVTSLVLHFSNLVTVTSWSSLTLATVAVVAVEASTDQVDNITLPLIMYAILAYCG